jgi:uncharacterized phage-associated protein
LFESPWGYFMFFRLDTRKAIEAAATLLSLAPHRLMSRKRLLALLYLADRESLKRSGRPIVGGRLVAMDYGPIHSEVYDLIKGSHSQRAPWSRHFQNEGYLVKLVHDLGSAALSRNEVTLLNQISDERLGQDDWDIAQETHFEEYDKNYHEGTSTPIPLEHLIEAVGRAKDKDAILRDAEEKAFFDKMFARAT